MQAIWKAILRFFGFTNEQPKIRKSLGDLMRDISSQEKAQQAIQEAYNSALASSVLLRVDADRKLTSLGEWHLL